MFDASDPILRLAVLFHELAKAGLDGNREHVHLAIARAIKLLKDECPAIIKPLQRLLLRDLSSESMRHVGLPLVHVIA